MQSGVAPILIEKKNDYLYIPGYLYVSLFPFDSLSWCGLVVRLPLALEFLFFFFQGLHQGLKN